MKDQQVGQIVTQTVPIDRGDEADEEELHWPSVGIIK